MDNSNPEFVVPEKLEQLIRDRDFGRWADRKTEELQVCFIHGTDITGGNSGSPVLNANGDLIGLVFDGNWEAMSGDIAFEDELQRTISVDVRYIMWILEKFAGATNLIDEMDFTAGAKANRPIRRGPSAGQGNESRQNTLEALGLTREQFEAMTPDQRKALRDQLREEKDEKKERKQKD
jgi:S1-C subfamily serine protease